MERCPPEIHALIFTYACTDDGTTGRSLASVSRYIRQVSTPFQWQCLAIAGIAQAEGFVHSILRTFKDPGASDRPIYHLFLSTRALVHADSTDGCPTPEHEWAAWPVLQGAILTFAAPTLQTLTMASFNSIPQSAACLAALFGVPFPQLTELTIRGRCTPAQLAYTNNADAGAENELRPKLRRLHLACAYHGFAYGTKATHELVRTLAPRATHLRLSMLDKWGSRRVAEILHAECAERGIAPPVLVLPTPPAHPPHVPMRLPKSAAAKSVVWPRVLPLDVRAFVLQPPPTAATNFYCSCCMDTQGDADVLRVFGALAAQADERFVYAPARGKVGYGYAEARVDWLERIGGGAGCWAAKEPEEVTECRGLAKDAPCAAQKGKAKGGVGARQVLRRSARKKVTRLMKKVKSWWVKLNASDDDGFGLPVI